MSTPFALPASGSHDARGYPDLAGKRIFIAGAPLGAGSRIARAFARHGCRIVLHFDRHREHMFALADRIRGQVRGLRVFHCSLKDGGAVERLTEAADGAFDGLDAVVTIAGQVPEGLLETEPEHLERAVARSLVAPYRIASEAARHMRERGIAGSIVHVSAQPARATTARVVLQAMTRVGLEAMAQDQARAWEHHGIRVNAVMAEGPDLSQATGRPSADASLRRLSEADSTAAAALFLASSEAASLSGMTLTSPV